MNLLNSKKGQAENHLAIVIFLFLFGFMSFIAALLMLNIISAYTDAGLYVGVIASTGNSFYSAVLLFDKIIVLMMAALLVGLALTSYNLRASPAFFIVTVIMGAFTGLVSFFFNHIFIQIVSQEIFNTVIALFPMTLLVCTNFHWISLAAIVIGSISLYAKSPNEGQIQTGGGFQ